MSINRIGIDATVEDTITSDLEILLTHEFKSREAMPQDTGQRYTALRLQPVVLQPPPGEEASHDFWPDHAPSPEDDIDLGLDDDQIARRRQLIFAAIGIGVAITGAAAFLALGTNSDSSAVRTPVPTIQSDPAALTRGAAPASLSEPSPSPGQAVGDQAMGAVSTELVPPTTDGLSPARRIATTRIIVENDREVTTPR